MTEEDLLHLVLDVVTLGSVEDMSLVVSFNHLQRRVKERNMIIADFQESGGRYLRKFGQMKDQEQADFTTTVFQTEVERKIIVNVEKDFSDSKVDIKVFETTLQSKPTWRKL